MKNLLIGKRRLADMIASHDAEELRRQLLRTRSILAWPVLGVLGLQLLLGIANVVLVLPLANATLHNAVAAVLLVTLVTVNYRAQRGGTIH